MGEIEPSIHGLEMSTSNELDLQDSSISVAPNAHEMQEGRSNTIDELETSVTTCLDQEEPISDQESQGKIVNIKTDTWNKPSEPTVCQ